MGGVVFVCVGRCPTARRQRVEELLVAGMESRKFVLLIFGVALLVFFMPFGNWRDFKMLAMIATSSAPTYIGGNSVLKHMSLCDSDRRYISAMTSEASASPLLDISYGGQSLREQIAYLGFAVRNPKSQTLIASASIVDFDPAPEASLRRRWLLDIINPAGEFSAKGGAGSLAQFILGKDLPLDFEYLGERYPSYDYVKRKYFSVERDNAKCPEGNGVNGGFVEAIYFGTYAKNFTDTAAVRLVADLAKIAKSRSRRFLLVLQPIDFELIEGMHVDWVKAIREKRDRVKVALATAGVEVVDLTELLSNDDFADRWCACGHLQDRGRRSVAKKISEHLRARLD
jgi:hypothetical protein